MTSLLTTSEIESATPETLRLALAKAGDDIRAALASKDLAAYEVARARETEFFDAICMAPTPPPPAIREPYPYLTTGDLDVVAERALAGLELEECWSDAGVSLIATVGGRRVIVAGDLGVDRYGRDARLELGLSVAWVKAGCP